MVQFIPNNLNIVKFLEQHPPFNIVGFKIDKLVHILNLLYLIPANNKSLIVVDGYVPIYSVLLKKKIENYRDYLDYLCQNNILECDGIYIKSTKSKGYRFTTKYINKPLKKINITDRTLIKKIKKLKNEKFQSLIGYEYLTKWLWDGNLVMDYKTARYFAFKDFQNKDKFPELRERQKNNKYKDHRTQYTSVLLNIDRLKNHDMYMSVDPNVHRFHSNLTCMKSIYRNLLTYDGQKLVSIDIKNSQPYLSTKLLDPKFWFCNKYENIYKNKFTTTIEVDDFIKFYSINKSLFSQLFQNSTIYSCIIMCLKSVKMPINKDVATFVESVSKGNFYELLSEMIKQEMNLSITDRKELKAIVFLVLFTDNRFIGQDDAAPKKIFRELFPTIYRLFALIKKRDKSILPRILQTIESHLMLKVIAKRISKERPSLPIFTIHDSIATTVGNEDYVQKVMQEELTKYIGHSPTLSVEYWTPENMIHKTVSKEFAA
jgi:hypothetical protein